MRQNKLKRIGITGGIGAGKTTVAEIFDKAGLLVVDADMVSRDVLELYPEIANYIRRCYQEEYFRADGSLDRRKFGKMVFSDPAALADYEKVIMPCIVDEINERFAFIEEATEDEFAVLDAPLLFEVGEEPVHDVAITVEMPLDLQIQRVMARDGLSETDVVNRIQRQRSRAQRESLSDYVIVNDGSLEELTNKALQILDEIKHRG